MSWMLSIWLAAAVLALSKGENTVHEGNSLSSSGYHLCVRNETRVVTFLAMHKVPYTETKPCGWLWKTCSVTEYRITYQTEYKTVTEQVTGCCDGYVQVGHYCALSVNRSGEFSAKPGSCPTADGLYHGSEDCEWDMDCPGWQKCCLRSDRSLCSDPASPANYSENGGCRFNATVTVKIDYEQLMSTEGGHLNHLRLLQAMVTGALQSDASVYYLSSWPVHPYRTATSMLIDCNFTVSLYNVTSKLHLLLKHILEVSSVTVEDVDECAQPALRQCSPQADCNNTVGSYRCACRQGYIDVDPSNPGAHCTADVSVLTTTETLVVSLPPMNTTYTPATDTTQDPQDNSTTGLFSSTETSMTTALSNTSSVPSNTSHAPQWTSSAPYSSMSSTVETPLPPTTCSPLSITSLWSANVTGNSFCVYWSSQFQTNQTYWVVVSKGSEVICSWETSQTMMEVRRLQSGVLYNVTITPCACGNQGIALHISVRTADVSVLTTTETLVVSLPPMNTTYTPASDTTQDPQDNSTTGLFSSTETSMTTALSNTSSVPSNTSHAPQWTSSAPYSSMSSTVETPLPTTTCSPPSITSLWSANVTGNSFCVYWSSQFQTNHTYLVVVSKGSEVIRSWETSQTMMEVKGLQSGVLYNVTVTPCAACGSRGIALHISVRTDAQTLDATARLTNIQFTADLQNTSSQAYKNLTESIAEEIYQSLSPEMKAMMDSGQVRIEIRGFSSGSVVVNITFIFTPSQSQDISNVSTSLLHSLMNSTKYTVDKNKTSINDFNECASGENDCSQWATCTNTWGSYTCVCLEGFIDNNLERPGRACQAIATSETMTPTILTTTTAPTTTTTAPTTTTTAPTTTTTAPTTTTTAPTTTTTASTTTTTAPTTTTTAPTTTTTAPTTTTTAPTTTTTAPTTTTTTPTTTTTAPTTTTTAPTTTTIAPTTSTTAPKIIITALTTTITAPTTTTTAPTTTTTAPTTTTTAPTTTTTAPTTTTTALTTTTTALTTTTTAPTTTTTAPTTTTTAPTTTPTPTTIVTSLTTTITSLTTSATASRAANNISMLGAVSVECRVAAITVTVARDFLQRAKIRESTLYLGVPECAVNGGNATHAQLTVAWDECATKLVHNKTHYTASVTMLNNMDQYTSSSGTVEVPRIRLEVPIICVYMKSMLISADFDTIGFDMIKDVITGSGSFQVTVQLMNGTTPLPHNYSLSPEDAVVVAVSLNTSSEQIKVVINKCWATPTQSPVDTFSHIFLENSCSLNTYTKVLMNGNSSTSQVSVKIFSFVNLNVIYLHCQVQICAQIGSDTCVPDCLQRTARSSNTIGTAFGSSGPLLKSDEESLEEEYNTLHIVGLSFLGIGLSLFFIIGFVCLFYYQRNRIGHYNFSAKPKQENFTYLVFNT